MGGDSSDAGDSVDLLWNTVTIFYLLRMIWWSSILFFQHVYYWHIDYCNMRRRKKKRVTTMKMYGMDNDIPLTSDSLNSS